MKQISEHLLFRSCEVLFGTELNVSRQFLDYLQISGIKSAYRKRALETHPDRLVGLHPPQGAEQFHAVREAYETLLFFLETKKLRRQTIYAFTEERQAAAGRPKPAAPLKRHFHATRNDSGQFCRKRIIKPIILPDDTHKATVYANTESFYQGPLPRRHLLFGHFLYYSGLANWRTITRILTWQRTERPRLGELARRFGMCRQEDIAAILRARKPFRHFGETAQMLGLLSEQQVRVLIFHQQRMQKKFGAILLEKNLIVESDLQELLDRFECHNAALQAQ